MSLSNPLASNMLIGGVNSSSTLGADADTLALEFVPEIWGQAILESFNKNTIMTQVGTNLSAIAQAQGGDKIRLPHVGVPTVKAVTQNADVLEQDNSGTDTGVDTELVIDQHYAAPLWLPDAVKAQSAYDLFSLYSGQLGYAIAKAVDNHLMYTVVAKLTSVLGSGDGVNANATMNVEVGEALTPAHLASLMAIITAETGGTEGWTVVLSPKAYGSLANSSNFGNAFTQGLAGLASDFSGQGIVGSLLGMPVIASNSVFMDVGSVAQSTGAGIHTAWDGFDTGASTDDDYLRGFAIHESALYWAIQDQNVKQSYQHVKMSDLISVDSLYGAVARTADSAGSRRIISLTDSKT
tara:strand:+ start:35 stop:1090 length:1056 start_codon:yes stop_codon:yes gene_type:complete